jgi:hypothetical protein
MVTTCHMCALRWSREEATHQRDVCSSNNVSVSWTIMCMNSLNKRITNSGSCVIVRLHISSTKKFLSISVQWKVFEGSIFLWLLRITDQPWIEPFTHKVSRASLVLFPISIPGATTIHNSEMSIGTQAGMAFHTHLPIVVSLPVGILNLYRVEERINSLLQHESIVQLFQYCTRLLNRILDKPLLSYSTLYTP